MSTSEDSLVTVDYHKQVFLKRPLRVHFELTPHFFFHKICAPKNEA
jgi:hypothetical protein